MKELEKYKKALTGARHALGMIQRNPQVLNRADYLADVQREIDSILNPPPEMEEVEIERFVVFYPDGSTSHILTREGLQGFDCKRGTVKRVSHMVERPKPQPVKRTVSGTVQWRAQGGMTFPVGKDVNFDWDDVLGKTGELTFTWTEDPK